MSKKPAGFKEKDFQSIFGRYLKANNPPHTEVYELKVCKGTSMPFSDVKSHQVEGLSDAVCTQGLYHKISDAPIHKGMRTRFNKPKPFDCLHIQAHTAYVVILFYKFREEKFAVMIRIEDWIRERESSTRKSITPERAEEIAEKVLSMRGY